MNVSPQRGFAGLQEFAQDILSFAAPYGHKVFSFSNPTEGGASVMQV
jgi:hypothetical protein